MSEKKNQKEQRDPTLGQQLSQGQTLAWQIAVEEDKRLVPVAILQVGEENATELLALKTNLADRRTEQLLDDFAIAETPDFTNPIKFNIIIAVKSFFKRNYRDLAKASGKIVVSKE